MNDIKLFTFCKYLQRSLAEAGRGYPKPLCSGLREPLPASKRRGEELADELKDKDELKNKMEDCHARKRCSLAMTSYYLIH